MRFLSPTVELFRKWYYRILSGNYSQMSGKPLLRQPLQMEGDGKVIMGKQVQIGYELSPHFWSSYAYFDLRGADSLIRLGDGVILNNNASLSADGASITIGNYTITGVNLSIITSDGHCLNPKQRHHVSYQRASVNIGEYVFIGDNVLILKGVNIGNNSVIGAGSVVTSDIPENVVAAGNPCRVIRPLSEQK